MSDSELVLYGFCAGFFAAELLIVWILRAHRPKAPTQPNAPTYASTDCGHACEWVAPYGWVPEADCPVHDAPRPPVSEHSLITAIAHRHNTREARN